MKLQEYKIILGFRLFILLFGSIKSNIYLTDNTADRWVCPVHASGRPLVDEVSFNKNSWIISHNRIIFFYLKYKIKVVTPFTLLTGFKANVGQVILLYSYGTRVG